ncbi:Clavaminate synthase-like protein [Schizopora paradoxa]|uniref:Clavaminate synthase-like protein n=1 Tax=Schizopora paradoxa TaxID=27342 RepID=A0A0H2RL12_9AGAM|nr:Clavaminate synthase-like protein [Schizopora paradoxa]
MPVAGIDLANPPFPNNVPTHPLLVIDYTLIKSGDKPEIERLWKAATELGFWYLKNHGTEHEVNEMFEMGAETLKLPLDEKMKFEQGDEGKSFGYKMAGALVSDEHGTPDTVEFLNISKDDALAFPAVAHRTYPSTVNARMFSTVKPFVQKSLEVNETILAVLEDKLRLPEGALRACHPNTQFSYSEARCIRNPPKLRDDEAEVSPSPNDDPNSTKKAKIALGPHSDFGSLTILHNRLGGLQVLPPGLPASDESSWSYVLPMPGHAICNIGDSLAILSGGILRSNIHRVVSPPGEQAYHARWSLVFFTRPGNGVRLGAFSEKSDLIKAAMERMQPELKSVFESNVTAGEWVNKRNRLGRVNNRKGPETYRAGAGVDIVQVQSQQQAQTRA